MTPDEITAMEAKLRDVESRLKIAEDALRNGLTDLKGQQATIQAQARFVDRLRNESVLVNDRCEIAEEALKEYATENNWSCADCLNGDHPGEHQSDVWIKYRGKGPDTAVKALAEIKIR